MDPVKTLPKKVTRNLLTFGLEYESMIPESKKMEGESNKQGRRKQKIE
jgi:hypothetical protein